MPSVIIILSLIIAVLLFIGLKFLRKDSRHKAFELIDEGLYQEVIDLLSEKYERDPHKYTRFFGR